MDDENLFETNLADSAWQWDFIDFWATPKSKRHETWKGKRRQGAIPGKGSVTCSFPEE